MEIRLGSSMPRPELGRDCRALARLLLASAAGFLPMPPSFSKRPARSGLGAFGAPAASSVPVRGGGRAPFPLFGALGYV